MCTRFVVRGEDVITGFNFDIDLAVWDHRVMVDAQRFFIGILQPDGVRHGYHGVHANGNVGTLLYVHGNDAGAYREGKDCVTVAHLVEAFNDGRLDYEAARAVLEEKEVTYAADATMQAVLSDAQGRTLIVEPGIGWREERRTRFSLVTNYSLLAPDITKPFILPGDDRYERAQVLLSASDGAFDVADAFEVLRAVRQPEPWATRVSFVYSAKARTVYYCENGDFAKVRKVAWPYES